MKLAIIDLDGVVADNTERFKRAEEARQAYADAHKVGNVVLREYGSPSVNDIYWQAAFNPDLVALDTLIEGVYAALLQLERQDYTIYFLTSRPESMREATGDWLAKQKVAYSRDAQGHLIARTLIMKAAAFQYVKTVTWKAGMVETLAAFHGADEALFVDDESANTTAVAESWQNAAMRLRTWSALKLAFVAGSSDEE